MGYSNYTVHIPVKSALARTLAKTLKVPIRKLDEMDGKRDTFIDLPEIERSKSKLGLGKRIFHAWVPPHEKYGTCTNGGFFIDNGDGKIGKGDLFVFYLTQAFANCTMYRFARLFKPRKVESPKVRPPRGKFYRCGATVSRGENHLLKKIEKLKGKSYSDKAVRFILSCRYRHLS